MKNACFSRARWLVALVVLLALVASICWAAQAAHRLLINGKVASTDVRMINGRAYVPVSDVAHALEMPVTESNGDYTIAPAGGAYQVNGAYQGKIGTEIFTGKWRFQVTGVQQATTYEERYYQEKRTIRPHGRGDVLYLVNCRMKNGLKKTQSPLVTERIPGNTNVADDKGLSYAPIDYDARQQSDKTQSYEGAPLLPGAAMEFTLVFSIPEKSKITALVYTAGTYPDDVGNTKAKDVRVNLTQ